MCRRRVATWGIAAIAAVAIGAAPIGHARADTASPTPSATPTPPTVAPATSPLPTPTPAMMMPPSAAPQTPSATPAPPPDPDLYPAVVHPFITPTPGTEATPGIAETAAPPSPPPGFGRLTADRLYGKASGDMDADGHVLIVSGDSSITADRAHYDAATRTIRAIGDVHYVSANGDTASAKALDYDVAHDRIIMDGVEGQTSAIAFQSERIHGYLYYKGERITIDHNGHAILEHGWVTTCALNHVSYHVTGKEIEIRPNDRLIAHGPALYLGKYLVAGLGILAIPLTQEAARRPTAFAPRLGYNSIYGVFLKNYINFYSSPYFYGTYHFDIYQKAGIGVGVDIYFARRDGLGSGEFTIYDLHSNNYQFEQTGVRNSLNSNLTLQRVFSHHVTFSANASYVSQSLLTTIPPTLSANVNVAHNGARSTTSYGATVTSTGPSSSVGGIINHNIAFSPIFSENVSLQLQYNNSVFGAGTSFESSSYSRSVLFMNDTHYSARAVDADLVISTDHGETSDTLNGMTSTQPVIGLQKVPELTVRSRPFSVGSLRLPIQLSLVDGVYDDGYNNITTARYELNGQAGTALYRIGDSVTVSGLVGIRQDIYGTGDERGALNEQFSLQKFFGRHADNTLAYQMQSVRGYTPMPAYDLLTGFDQINENLNIYNGSAYRFTATTNYDFKNKFLGSINYQLNVAPSPYSNVLLGDSYDPHGTGYGPLAITLSTPIGRDDYLQFLGNYDFKLHGLQGQNYFLTHTVGDCYQIRLAYRQALHEFDVSFALLAFPSQAVNFGLTGSSILPQSFGSP
ncbi:MAG: LPS-assembly protein LptD [Candidatus Eremiobacteraeota bacterium]|nr:LPS-assembly protein LptD [Candidatus Eremiobacteraeota bacterium]